MSKILLVEDDPKEPKYIQTVRGFGYRWDAPVSGM